MLCILQTSPVSCVLLESIVMVQWHVIVLYLYDVASEKMREAEEMMSKMLQKPHTGYSPELPPSRPHNYVESSTETSMR